jgi:uncharacterized OsmC-like protein
MTTSIVTYHGDLRTEAKHVNSNNKIITDAPLDNQGKGEAFSPTDLTATSLASCMMTIMGIVAKREGITLEGCLAEVTKIMGTEPRRIIEIKVDLKIKDFYLTDKQKRILENAALTCPVAKSLHPDIKQNVNFEYL